MIRELDRIVLTAPVPDEGLEAGDAGTVVAVYADGKARGTVERPLAFPPVEAAWSLL